MQHWCDTHPSLTRQYDSVRILVRGETTATLSLNRSIILNETLFFVSNRNMKPETEKLFEDTRRRLFESDEFRISRDLIQWAPHNTGDIEDLDVLLDRVDQFAPMMKQWADSFNIPQSENTEQ